MNRMAVLSGSVPVRFGSRFLPVARFMLARGRGGVEVLEQVLKTSTPPRARGNAREHRSCAVFVWWEGNLHSLLPRRSNKQGWGCWAAELGVLGRGRGGVQVLENLGTVRFTGRFLAVRCNMAVRFLRFGSVPEPS